MELVQAIGAPFNLHQSSCSDKQPKLFSWTGDDAPIKVYIDGAITHGYTQPKKRGEKKIAWICESRAIFYNHMVPQDIFEKHLDHMMPIFSLIGNFVKGIPKCNSHLLEVIFLGLMTIKFLLKAN